MKYGYRFSNLCGNVYKCGNLVFSPDGSVLYSPIGNRITAFDLIKYVLSNGHQPATAFEHGGSIRL